MKYYFEYLGRTIIAKLISNIGGYVILEDNSGNEYHTIEECIKPL